MNFPEFSKALSNLQDCVLGTEILAHTEVMKQSKQVQFVEIRTLILRSMVQYKIFIWNLYRDVVNNHNFKNEMVTKKTIFN